MHFISSVFKAAIALAMMVAVILVAVLLFTSVNLRFSSDTAGANPGANPTKTAQKVMFTVQPGQSVATIADNLKSEGIIDSPTWFRLRLKLRGDESALKAGRFQVTPGMDVDGLIDLLTTSPTELGVRFTVIEGTRIGEIADKLAGEGIVDAATFNKLAGTAEGAAQYQDDFLNAAGKPANQGLEGYLFPDTYEIKQNSGDNSDAVIKKMLGTLEAKFTPDMLQQIKDGQKSIHQVLTIASIVQREGLVKEELPTIAAVFWNRLDRGMRLDADPTTQFALGKSGEWWPSLDKYIQQGHALGDLDNPYNTYRIPAMPPGPISNPGLDAIQAAISPAKNEYLYFVAKGDGSGTHLFARTLEEQEQHRAEVGNK
ncbi:MAG: endolytic transglycosylase MltG [Chloroflexia bacterium]